MRPVTILEKIFHEQINVSSISQPTTYLSPDEARELCRQHNFDYHLVRRSREERMLLYSKAEDSFYPLDEKLIIAGDTPILEVLDIMMDQPVLFVMEKTKITRVVTQADQIYTATSA